MFDTINGMPLHPLVVHGVVVLLPLAALGTIAIAVRPVWRRTYGHLVVATTAVDLPVKKGQRLGEVRVFDGSRLVASSPLVAARAVERPGFVSRASWYAGQALGSIWP